MQWDCGDRSPNTKALTGYPHSKSILLTTLWMIYLPMLLARPTDAVALNGGDRRVECLFRSQRSETEMCGLQLTIGGGLGPVEANHLQGE
jgi:hypothetical protein